MPEAAPVIITGLLAMSLRFLAICTPYPRPALLTRGLHSLPAARMWSSIRFTRAARRP